ncbi:MAG TPA: hemerythrin domain-containing protein [Candidatus Acidoferrales bacterium]|nr:hemerythrin domain-containing protein [Candidatus Acidoferrales bacterium]
MYEQWEDSLSLGFPSLDQEHKRLFEIVAEMKEALESQPAAGATRRILERLVDYGQDDLHAMFHDASHCSPELATWLQEHRAEHIYLADRARAFMAFLGTDERTRLFELHFFLSRWLTDHIQSNRRTLEAIVSKSNHQ